LFLFNRLAFLVSKLEECHILLLPLLGNIINVLLWPVYLASYGWAALMVLLHQKLLQSGTSRNFINVWWEMWGRISIVPSSRLTWDDHLEWTDR
jgi:hypothetical protein